MMNKKLKFLIYKTEEEDVSVDTVVKDDTIWLTQKGMAEFFGVDVTTISKHLSDIFVDGELDEEVVVSIQETKSKHEVINGKPQIKLTKFYNLDAIISVGYRVNSTGGTNFRMWATSVLKEFMTKGVAMDKALLEQSKAAFGEELFNDGKDNE